MKSDADLKQRIASLSDDKLLGMIGKPEDYREDAIAYAKDEIERRGGKDSLMHNLVATTPSPAKETITSEMSELPMTQIVRGLRLVLGLLAFIMFISFLALGQHFTAPSTSVTSQGKLALALAAGITLIFAAGWYVAKLWARRIAERSLTLQTSGIDNASQAKKAETTLINPNKAISKTITERSLTLQTTDLDNAIQAKEAEITSLSALIDPTEAASKILDNSRIIAIAAGFIVFLVCLQCLEYLPKNATALAIVPILCVGGILGGLIAIGSRRIYLRVVAQRNPRIEEVRQIRRRIRDVKNALAELRATKYDLGK